MPSDISPIGGAPPPNPNSPPPGPNSPPTPNYFHGGGWGAFKKWLGPADYAKFENNLCQAINNQIGQDKARNQKAARELRKSETGRGV